MKQVSQLMLFFCAFHFSPSDLDADDEDNQNQSDSTVSSFAQPRPGTPMAESVEEVSANKFHCILARNKILSSPYANDSSKG